jgi:hypothetical protein
MILIPRIGGTTIFLAAWLMPWRPAFKVRATGSQLKFFVHHRDLIGRHIAKYGTREPVRTRWLVNYLTHAPKGIFIDVGANLGWHTVHAARHPCVEMVVAFEPDPFNAWLLDRNLIENGVENVIVSNAAVGAQSGNIRLQRCKSSNYGFAADRLRLRLAHGTDRGPRWGAPSAWACRPGGERSQNRRREL